MPYSSLDLLRLFSAPAHRAQERAALSVEALEDRMMLSTVTIFAAGSTGEEDMKLVINDQVVKTFKDIGGDPDAREFEQISWQVPDGTTANDIKIRFSNDFYDPANGIDRNLTVDKIVLDGQTFETESRQVFSTGTWNEASGIVPGYGRGETLHANGYFDYYSSDQQGTQLSVRARGEGGPAAFDILIDGQVAASFVAPETQTTFEYVHPTEVSLDQIRIAFTNDQYDPATGTDVNLVVDFLNYEQTGIFTNDATVFSTGTWLPADGVSSGFGRGNTLHTNGYFQFASFEASRESLEMVDEIGPPSYMIEVDDTSKRIATLSSVGTDPSGDTINLYNPDGSVASEFGSNGSVNLEQLTGLDPGNDFVISDISFYPDGSLLLSGRNFNFVGVSVPYLLKLTPNGTLDSNFNNGFFTNTLLGIAANDSGGSFQSVIDAQGNATLIGNVFNSSNDTVALRLNSDGQVDTSWGFGGTLRIIGNGTGNFPDTEIIGAELLNDGSILVGILHSNDLDFPPTMIAKINPNGFLDSSYGSNGIATITPEQQFYSFNNLRADSQGRAVLGSTQELARLDFLGNTDITFNTIGRVNYSDGQFVEDGLEAFQGIDSMVIDQRDRIILTSSTRTETGRRSFNYDGTTVLRFDVDGRYDTNFDDEGIQVLDVNILNSSRSINEIAIDGDGNLLVSAGATGPVSDPTTTDRSLTRFRFA